MTKKDNFPSSIDLSDLAKIYPAKQQTTEAKVESKGDSKQETKSDRSTEVDAAVLVAVGSFKAAQAPQAAATAATEQKITKVVPAAENKM